MTFWMGVTVVYVVVIAVGLTVGRHLAERFQRGGNDGRGPAPDIEPAPGGPAHALARPAFDCPPLGSAFDRALLPGAFDDVTASDPAS